MMRSTLAAPLFLLLALSGGFDASAATNASGPPPAIALLSEGQSLLEWIPLVQYESITLALADPQGVVRTFQFGPGTAPALSLFDAQGVPLPDGTYTWELRAARLVQSGHFSMSNGRLMASDQTERPEHRSRKSTPGVTMAPDQVVPDDLIVDGKGCIGLGCGNNEAFGPETLRLKQSVVRLRFEDTSAQAGFPGRDWQLTLNDAGSGGADRFSIEDLTAGTTPLTVRGGAPNNSLYVDASGRLGLGTATPAERLHVLENVDANTLITSENPNTGLNALAALRARSDSAIVSFQAHGSGRTLSRFGQPLASWAELLQVTGNGLIIGTLADKPLLLGTNSTNRIHIAPNGNVGLGTSTPASPLHLQGAAGGDAVMRVRNTSNPGYSGIEFIDHAGTPRFFFGVNNSNSTTRLNSFSSTPFLLMTNSVERIRIDPGGNVGLGCTDPAARLVIGGFGASCSTAPFSSINPGASTFTTSSSRSYKENLQRMDIPDILQRIAGVGVFTYDFIDGPKNRLGLVAEEFHQVFGRGSDKLIEGGEIEMALWLAVQHLSQLNQELTSRNEEVEMRLKAIEARLQQRP